MINQSFYRVIPTSLDINGPYLSFVQTPSGISGDVGDTVTFVGVATASFLGIGNTAIPTGSIAYRWYEKGVGPLSDGNRLSGTGTTTLTLTNLQTSDSNRIFFVEAKFNPSAYSSGKNGRAVNEPVYSNEVGPEAEIINPPTLTLTASPSSIGYNGSTTLSWSSSNADTLSSNFGETRLTGSKTVSLRSSTTFRATATNRGGDTTREVRVNVGAPPPPPPPPPQPPADVYSFSGGEINSNYSETSYAGSVSQYVSGTIYDTIRISYGAFRVKSFVIFDDIGTILRSENYSTEQFNVSGSFNYSNLTRNPTRFTFRASNDNGSESRSFSINIRPRLRITEQPRNAEVTYNKCTNSGGSITFSTNATLDAGSGTINYQWYLNGNALSDSADVSGSKTKTLTLKVLENQGGNNIVYAKVSYGGSSGFIGNYRLEEQTNSINYIVNVIEPRPIITQTAGDPLDQTIIIGETATFNIRASASDGRSLNYQWTNNGRPFVDGTNNSSFPFGTISGATTPTLRYTPSSTSASGIIYAIITDPSSNCTASNSPFESELAAFTVRNPSKIIKIASRGGNTSSMSYSNFDLFSGNYTSSGQIEFVSPFQDIQVDIKMLGGAGGNNGSYRGGQGGTSIIRLTLRRNVEYIIRTVVGGSTGGASCVLYDRARLIAVVGGGGGAGTDGNGGVGGGAGLAGKNGQSVFGYGAGRGGDKKVASLGYFPGGDPYCQTITSGSIFGGVISSCTIGGETCRSNPTDQFWIKNYSPCSSYAGLARDRNGNRISNSLNLERGFKEGIGHRQNGGIRATSAEGGGGNGSEGGWAGLPGSRAGGGGGGGYANGVDVRISTEGGNSGGASFTIGLVGRV